MEADAGSDVVSLQAVTLTFHRDGAGGGRGSDENQFFFFPFSLYSICPGCWALIQIQRLPSPAYFVYESPYLKIYHY